MVSTHVCVSYLEHEMATAVFMGASELIKMFKMNQRLVMLVTSRSLSNRVQVHASPAFDNNFLHTRKSQVLGVKRTVRTIIEYCR